MAAASTEVRSYTLTDTPSLPGPPAEAIEIRVEHAGQLFDTLDPFPFREKGLDPSAEKYIVDWKYANLD